MAVQIPQILQIQIFFSKCAVTVFNNPVGWIISHQSLIKELYIIIEIFIVDIIIVGCLHED